MGYVVDVPEGSSGAAPGAYGFVRGTLTGDGGPLEAIVCTARPIPAGGAISVRPIAALAPRDVVVCAAEDDDLDRLPAELASAIEAFFGAEGGTWSGPDAALALVLESEMRLRASSVGPAR